MVAARRRLNAVLQIALPAAVAALLLWVVLRQVDGGTIVMTVAGANGWLLVAALAVLFTAQPLVVLRWLVVLRALGSTVSFRRAFGVYLTNLPVAKVTPLYTGDYLRAVFLRDVVPLGQGAGSILAEALLDLSVVGALSAIGGAVAGRVGVLVAGAAVAGSALVVSMLLSLSFARHLLGRWPRAAGFTEAFAALRRRPSSLALAVTLTLLAWLPTIIAIWLALAALGAPVALTEVLAVQPIVTLVSFIPITISGIGARESSMLVLYAGLAPAAAVAAVGLLYSAISAVALPLICLPFTLRAVRATLRQYADRKLRGGPSAGA